MGTSVMLTITNITGGGAERVVATWANKLADMGFTVYLLISGRTANEYAISEKVKIVCIAPTYEDYIKLCKFEQFKRRRALLKQYCPTYIISFLPHIQILTLFSSFGLGIKRVETIRNAPFETYKRRGILVRFLWKRCFDYAYKIILQTNEQIDFFNENNRKKCVVISNPIAEKFVENYKKEFTGNPKTLVAVGRITSQKNYEMMISAFAKVYRTNPNLTLNIYGHDEEKIQWKLELLAQELGCFYGVRFMGRTNNILDAYLHADIFIMSSNFEGMPNALAEALACKLICISTNCKTGPKDMIDSGVNGFLVPVNNVEALAETIIKVLSFDTEKRIKIGEAGRKRILELCDNDENFNKLAMVLKG